MNLDLARTVADAVLYEGYLLYPYRATSSKNQSRWQWGVLGPPGAASSGLGEEPSMSTQCLVRGRDGDVTVILRFLQIQARAVERLVATQPSRFEAVPELSVGPRTWMSWDEAIAHEITLGPCRLDEPIRGRTFDVTVDAGEELDTIEDAGQVVGRIVRRRWELAGIVHLSSALVGGDLVRLTVTVENTAKQTAADKAQATRTSFIGTHLLLTAERVEFVSLLEPSEEAREAAAQCQQQRCWPVLTGKPGETDVVLASPIILYDHPEVAEQSAGALFDSTEIDEILTLRVMTLTEEEKAAARATDPRAAEIIDRCDAMSPDSLQALHGILRDPHAGMNPTAGLADAGSGHSAPDMDAVPTYTEVPADGQKTDVRNLEPTSFDTNGAPWWDPAADASVSPEADAVQIGGVLVSKDSIVRLRPSRRADAQDLFFTGELARVTAVLSDVDGAVHVAVVLVDDPAADMHEWYGRYLYFAPEELEPLDTTAAKTTSDQREESRS